MITCVALPKCLYACIWILKGGEMHFFEYEEQWWRSKRTHQLQLDGFLSRAQASILRKAEDAGLTSKDVLDAQFYEELPHLKRPSKQK